MCDPRRFAKLVWREGGRRERGTGTKKRAEKGRKTRGVEDESEGWLWTVEWFGWIKRGRGGEGRTANIIGETVVWCT